MRGAAARWERVRKLTPGELVDAARAFFLLPVVGFALRRRGVRFLQARMGSRAPRRPVRRDPDAELEAARRLGWVVERVASRGPWRVTCLHRSLVLLWLLRRRGLAGDLRVGVRRRPGEAPGGDGLEFHAWVMHEDVVLNDSRDVGALFATFDWDAVPKDASWWSA